MKNFLLLFNVLLFIAAPILAQVGPTTLWEDNADTQWYNTQDTDFTITTEAELAGLSVLVAGGNDFSGKTINLDDNLDLGAHLWTPIGVDDVNPFSGTMDGQGFMIRSMLIEMPSASFLGLFGRCINATLLNINLQSPVIRGDDNLGALAGNLWQNGYVENCHAVAVDIESVGDNIGGLIGDVVQNGTVLKCSSQGTVTGGNQVGGLIGSPYDGATITECFTTGIVNGNHLAGGIIGASVVGMPGATVNTIEDCYSRAVITVANGYAGGLVGSAADLLTIKNSYSTGTVEGPEYDGGFIGGAGNVDTENNYWDTESSQHSGAIGGWQGNPGTPDITAKTTAEMKNYTMVALLNNGNGPWKMDPNKNDGYPGFEGTTSNVLDYKNNDYQLKVYPNNFNTVLHLDADIQLKSYIIYEVTGKMMKSGVINDNQAIINTEKINAGIYFLNISTSEDKITRKIIKP